jgi:hypothetical protein
MVTLDLSKVSAQMVAEDKSAQALLEWLCFRIQTFLLDWGEDRDSERRDLLSMAHDLRSAERGTLGSR